MLAKKMNSSLENKTWKKKKKKPIQQEWPVGLVAWFSLRVREVPGSTPGQAPFSALLEVQILQYNKNRKIKPKYKNEIIIKQTVKHTSNIRTFFKWIMQDFASCVHIQKKQVPVPRTSCKTEKEL